jgi:hypothetical protein
MAERRDRRGVRDVDIRTRSTDTITKQATPHGNHDWTSTYHLRWAEHQQTGRKARHNAA